MEAKEARVLVVDDDPGLCGLIKDVLSTCAGAVETVGSAQALFAGLAGPLPDLLILDLMLPDQHGLDVLRKLRGDQRTAGLKVLVITTLTEKSYRRAAEELGVSGYMTKPFPPPALAREVGRLLAG